jgi:hypothetical protein
MYGLLAEPNLSDLSGWVRREDAPPLDALVYFRNRL